MNPPLIHPEYRLVVFDPGGTIGWAVFRFDCRAFVKPGEKILRWLKSWNCGEFTGTENDQLHAASELMYRQRYAANALGTKIGHGVHTMDVVSEGFELTQTKGGDDLLSPVRINAVLDWELRRRCGLSLITQARQMRTSVTPERLRAYGFEGRWVKSGPGKDSFAAVQHGVVFMRRVKAAANRRPWIIRPGQMPIHGGVT